MDVPTAARALRLFPSPISRRSAPRRCGTNRSCACVATAVITVDAVVSQAGEQMGTDEGRQNANGCEAVCVCAAAAAAAAALDRQGVSTTGMNYLWKLI